MFVLLLLSTCPEAESEALGSAFINIIEEDDSFITPLRKSKTQVCGAGASKMRLGLVSFAGSENSESQKKCPDLSPNFDHPQLRLK